MKPSVARAILPEKQPSSQRAAGKLRFSIEKFGRKSIDGVQVDFLVLFKRQKSLLNAFDKLDLFYLQSTSTSFSAYFSSAKSYFKLYCRQSSLKLVYGGTYLLPNLL